MPNCIDCGRAFGSDGILDFDFRSICGSCKSRRKSDEAAEERERRREKEEERRHNERLEAEEEHFRKQHNLDEERRQEEEMRQLDAEARAEEREQEAEYEREVRAARSSAEREEFLAKQREQIANAWRYAAQSKLQQADKLYQAGARVDALTLAMEASTLGLDAQRLIGWIHRDNGNKKNYLEHLQVQIDLLRVDEARSHQERVLTEIVAIGKEGTGFLAKYFDVAKNWSRFPYSIHPLLLASGLGSFAGYRDLLSQHIDYIAKEQKENASSQYDVKFLELLLSLAEGEDLLDKYVRAAKDWSYFPHKVIGLLLEKQDAERATEIFVALAKTIKDDATNDIFVWKVCPLGIELNVRGKQPSAWRTRFKTAIDQLPFSQMKVSCVQDVLLSAAMSQKAKAQVREILEAKGKNTLSLERREHWKRLRKDKQSQSRRPWYQSPALFATVIAGVLFYLILQTGNGLPSAFLVAAPVYIISVIGKTSANTHHFARIRLSEWFNNRRLSIGSTLLITQPDKLDVLGSLNHSSEVSHLVKDSLTIFLILGLAGGLIFYATQTNSNTLNLARGSLTWTRDLEAFGSESLKWMTARLGLASKAAVSPRSAAPGTPMASTFPSGRGPAMPGASMAQDTRTGCRVWKPSLVPNDAVTWSGACPNGFAEGPGTAQWTANGKNTFSYEGSFHLGLLQGEGKMIAASGDRYEGHYRDGKRDGLGVYISSTGERYDGEFADNKRTGRGTLTHGDGSRLEDMSANAKPQAEVPQQRAQAVAVTPLPEAIVTATPQYPVAPRSTIKDLCSGRSWISEQRCLSRACLKAEYGSDVICVRMKQDEERRVQQQQQQ